MCTLNQLRVFTDDIHDIHDPADANDQASNIDGIVFDTESNLWIPDRSIKGMTDTPLPPSLPEEASPWVFNRRTTAEYIQSNCHIVWSTLVEKNMMLGKPCYPDQTGDCECGLPWKSATISFDCWFTARTCVGAVARRRYVAVCSCKQFIRWDPSAEFIHAISLEEGGMQNTRCWLFSNGFVTMTTLPL